VSKFGRDGCAQLAGFSENREHAPVDADDPARHRIAGELLTERRLEGRTPAEITKIQRRLIGCLPRNGG
jgi:hypothetical protein